MPVSRATNYTLPHPPSLLSPRLQPIAFKSFYGILSVAKLTCTIYHFSHLQPWWKTSYLSLPKDFIQHWWEVFVHLMEPLMCSPRPIEDATPRATHHNPNWTYWRSSSTCCKKHVNYSFPFNITSQMTFIRCISKVNCKTTFQEILITCGCGKCLSTQNQLLKRQLDLPCPCCHKLSLLNLNNKLIIE